MRQMTPLSVSTDSAVGAICCLLSSVWDSFMSNGDELQLVADTPIGRQLSGCASISLGHEQICAGRASLYHSVCRLPPERRPDEAPRRRSSRVGQLYGIPILQFNQMFRASHQALLLVRANRSLLAQQYIRSADHCPSLAISA